MNATSHTGKLPWAALILSFAFALFAFVSIERGAPAAWPIWTSVVFLCEFLISAGTQRKGQ
jgi:hypothetical protein